jgi:hypothetical protein
VTELTLGTGIQTPHLFEQQQKKSFYYLKRELFKGWKLTQAPSCPQLSRGYVQLGSVLDKNIN